MDARLKALQEIYDALPEIACQGKCWNSCGPIDMSTAERERIVELGYLIPTFTEEASKRWANNEPLHCPALNRLTKRCEVYEARPLICRAWGVAESMPCEHGCKPTRYLTDHEMYELLMASMVAGGHPQLNEADVAAFKRAIEDPEIAEMMGKFIRGDRSVEDDMKAALLRSRDA